MRNRFKKDYHNKNYKNPFFKNKQKEKNPRQYRLKFSICFFVIVVMAWFIFLFFSPYFKIKNINFGDTDKKLQQKIELLLQAELEKRKAILFSQQNYFIFNASNLSNQLNAMFLLNELEIKKKFPNILLIKAKEKRDVLAFLTEDNAFFIDKKGLIIDTVPENFKFYNIDNEDNATTTIDSLPVNPAKIELSDEISRKMPVISIDTIKKANIRDKVLSENLVTLILDVYQNLLTKLGVSPQLFEIEDEDEENKITVTTKDGWKIYFLTNEPIDNQLENLKVILIEKIGNNRALLDYIDLRFGDKIYYKNLD